MFIEMQKFLAMGLTLILMLIAVASNIVSIHHVNFNSVNLEQSINKYTSGQKFCNNSKIQSDECSNFISPASSSHSCSSSSCNTSSILLSVFKVDHKQPSRMSKMIQNAISPSNIFIDSIYRPPKFLFH